MRIFLEAQTENEKKTLGGEQVKIEGAKDGIVMLRCFEADVLPKQHSWSWGDVPWLVGKLEVAKAYLINLVRGFE